MDMFSLGTSTVLCLSGYPLYMSTKAAFSETVDVFGCQVTWTYPNPHVFIPEACRWFAGFEVG